MANPPSLVISAAVEGILDRATLERLVRDHSADLGNVYGMSGKARLLERMPGYANAARRAPWVVLIDLDQDAECAPLFLRERVKPVTGRPCLRVAVRAVESWLLADSVSLAAFLSVPVGRIPSRPDMLDDPKQAMVDLARRSRKPAVREDMVPRPQSGRAVGPAYASRLMEFAQTGWRPEVAAGNSDSLRRCREALEALVREWREGYSGSG